MQIAYFDPNGWQSDANYLVMRKIILTLSLVVVALGAVGVSVYGGVDEYEVVSVDRLLGDRPLFVTAMVDCQDGVLIAYSGEGKVVKLSKNLKKEIWSAPIVKPSGIACDESGIYVTTKTNEVVKLDLQGSEVARVKVKSGANAPIVKGNILVVLEQFANSVVKLDKNTLAELGRVQVAREPRAAVVNKDGSKAYVANFLPAQRADLDYVASDVSVVDLGKMVELSRIKLANGSNALRGVALTEDGEYVLVSHNLGRYTVPTSQLTQGWMNTSAMSVIATKDDKYIGAVVLDEPDRGAAGVWDIKCSKDHIYVSHSGTHDVSVIDYQQFKKKLETYAGNVETLAYDLRFMYGIRNRVAVVGNGPREMFIRSDDGVDELYVNTYFSDTINIIKGETLVVVPLVKDRKETLEQMGERVFNDASYCYQNWQSCNGCHPGDARTDGMNWDLMNDGVGNSKNCKSLLYSIQTPPSMISGIRTSAELANRKGFTHIQFYDIPESMVVAVDAYTRGLEAVESPYLVDGQLSEVAKEGRKVFEKFECDRCHSGPYYTDLKMYRIGEDIEFDAGWDTPTLREVWRTAPYLFDGRAETMQEVFEVHKHGIEKKITKKEIEQLSQYVLSL